MNRTAASLSVFILVLCIAGAAAGIGCCIKGLAPIAGICWAATAALAFSGAAFIRYAKRSTSGKESAE